MVICMGWRYHVFVNGNIDGIEYILTSADFINFSPKRIL